MADPLELDFFESPVLRTVRHPTFDGWNTLWDHGSQFSGGVNEVGFGFLSTEHSMSPNTHSYGTKILDGNARPWFMQHDRQTNFYMREMIAAGVWTLDTYNRMRFFVRPARGQQLGVTGSGEEVSYNFHLGTYCRDINESDTVTESDNMHFYHQMQMLVPERWNQFIIDWHPHRQRQVNDAIPIIIQYPQPETSPGHNYFDLLTRHYNKFFYWLGTREPIHLPEFYPGYAYMDHFEIYEDAQEASDAQDYIYGLAGVYDDRDESFHLGWSRQAGESSTVAEVRYAFSDAIQLGWENLFEPPNNRIASSSEPRRENMTFITTDIDPDVNDYVYFAIKHDDYAPMRQIVIPVVDSDLPPLPPSNP